MHKMHKKTKNKKQNNKKQKTKNPIQNTNYRSHDIDCEIGI